MPQRPLPANPMSWPRDVEPLAQLDDEERRPEKLVITNRQCHEEGDSYLDWRSLEPLRVSTPGAGRSSLRWRNSQRPTRTQHQGSPWEAGDGGEAPRREHWVTLKTQDLTRRQGELRRMEELHSQEARKPKRLELRQEERRRRRGEEKRRHQEETMRAGSKDSRDPSLTRESKRFG